MPNPIKYNLSQESKALKRGNFYIGTNDVGKGNTYYNGITPPSGGYTIYLNKASQGPSIYVAANDSALISLTNKIAGTNYTTVSECLSWFSTQTDKVVLNKDMPNVVTDSLSLYLDPDSVNSYPNTGTKWFDLASGLEFSSYGSQTSLTTYSGAKGFTFNGSGYWQCSSGYNSVDLAGDCTLIMWIYSADTFHNNRRTIFQKNGTTNQSYEQEIAVTWEGGTELSWYSRVSDYDYASTPQVGSSGWAMMGIKMSTGKTSACRTGFYSRNGGSWTNNYFCRSTTPVTTAADIVIGNGYAGVVEQGAIGMVLCYNKMLSDTELLQNFNATRSIYGV
jgi:hypothetical protein